MHTYLDTAFAGKVVDTEVGVMEDHLVSHVHASCYRPARRSLAQRDGGAQRCQCHKAAEKLLALSRRAGASVFESAPVGIAELDAKGTVIAANRP